MPTELWEARPPDASADQLWCPSERTRFWLPLGIGALFVDLSLGIAATALELTNWGKEGLTPDVVIGYAAIVPEALIVATYLVLARDAAARGLYKSMVGLFVSYLLFCLLSPVLLELLPRGWNEAAMLAVAAGIVGLVIFSVSKYPTLAEASQSLDETGTAPAERGGGWWIHVVVLVGLFVLRRLVRKNNFLGNWGRDEWAMVELAVVTAVACGYALWFAATKFRLRGKLGSAAAALGITELAILLIHAVLVAGLVYLMAAAVAANPQLDEDDVNKLLDGWLKQATVISIVCQAVWSLATAMFFVSLWMRPERDWRKQYLEPGKTD